MPNTPDQFPDTTKMVGQLEQMVQIAQIVRAHWNECRSRHAPKGADVSLTDAEFAHLLSDDYESFDEDPQEDIRLATRAYEAGAAAAQREIEELRAERDKYGLMASQFASANEELGEVSMREKREIAELRAELKEMQGRECDFG